MDDVIEKTQRWWATTSRTAFLSGAAIHVSDSPEPRDWGRLYRWHLIKQASVPTLLAGIGLALVAIVVLLPGTTVLAASVVKPVVVAVATVVLAAGIVLMTLAKRQPFSVITLPAAAPTEISEQLDELWPHLNDGTRERLRRALIKTYESQKSWSPQTLQQALLTQVERQRSRTLGGS